MAVTGFWPIYKNLKATLDYADNPDKTTAREYLDDDLYAALSYAENDNKTDRKMYVGGINCSKQNAYAEMVAVQRRFGLRGKVVGYHGIQSFREGEVTPEQAFEIGKATARKMWGNKYQVIVTVHLNTDNVHCHFVVNPVSFKDGTKFQNKIGDHKEFRRVSDEICREHGLSVLENSSFYGGNKKDYWRHKAGKKTHRDYLREDVEYCLSFATSPREFESQLYALGYTLDPVRFSVKAKHWKRSVRLANIGFTKEIVQAQLDRNAESRYRLFTLEYRPPYKPKKFPLEDELRKLEFSIDHRYDAVTVLVDTVFYLVITVIQIVAELADVMLLSPDLRAAKKDLKDLVADYHFLKENDIHTVADLQADIDESKAQLSDLERERNTLSNRIRRPKSPEDENQNKERRKEISKQWYNVFKEVKKMFDDMVNLFNLGAFSDEEKELLRTDFTYKKQMSRLLKEARQAAKRDTCYFCGKSVTSFCNSHSVPRFCLENIATNGDVLTLNTVVDNPLMDTENGVNKAGTFHLLCNDCDSKIFSDYENPDNYSNQPTPKMIAQMALKNSLKSISKRLFEIELFNISAKKTDAARMFSNAKNNANEMDLKEYENSYRKAKKALEKNSSTNYYVCYYEKLNYVVPIAFQCSLALAVDFNGNIINNIYNPSPEYRIQNIHISILPLKSETVIVIFIEDGDKRYRPFYKQFNKLTLEDKLAALTLIMFMYSEDMYFSKSIENEVRESKALCEAGKTGQDIVSFTPFFDPLEMLRESHSLDKRHEIPNLLSEKYKLA